MIAWGLGQLVTNSCKNTLDKMTPPAHNRRVNESSLSRHSGVIRILLFLFGFEICTELNTFAATSPRNPKRLPRSHKSFDPKLFLLGSPASWATSPNAWMVERQLRQTFKFYFDFCGR